MGFLDEEEKYKIMKSCKIFMFPSFYESWGIVSAEAMACGLPVVAYDLPIFKNIFPKGMIRVPIGDIGQFAVRVLELLDAEDLRKAISKAAKEFIKKYDWEKISKKELKILKKLK
jgi:glycosyltransferase involved in cell wall biosynthesis